MCNFGSCQRNSSPRVDHLKMRLRLHCLLLFIFWTWNKAEEPFVYNICNRSLSAHIHRRFCPEANLVVYCVGPNVRRFTYCQNVFFFYFFFFFHPILSFSLCVDVWFFYMLRINAAVETKKERRKMSAFNCRKTNK